MEEAMNPQPTSKCHNAPVRVASSDEGTSYYVCAECRQPCDTQANPFQNGNSSPGVPESGDKEMTMQEFTNVVAEYVLLNYYEMSQWFDDHEIDVYELTHGSRHGRVTDPELGGELLDWVDEAGAMGIPRSELFDKVDLSQLGRGVREMVKK
jgi:hypothetical protein